MSGGLHILIPQFMLWFLLPLWLVAGIADYVLHRHSAIELTSGMKETLLHFLEALEIALPLLAGLFLEINGLVLAFMIVCVVAHTLTAIWDTSYTAPRRNISPLEQHVHSHLEYIPIMALSLVALMYWDSLDHAPWSLRLKSVPIPGRVVLWTLTLAMLIPGILLCEEMVRVARRGKA